MERKSLRDGAGSVLWWSLPKPPHDANAAGCRVAASVCRHRPPPQQRGSGRSRRQRNSALVGLQLRRESRAASKSPLQEPDNSRACHTVHAALHSKTQRRGKTDAKSCVGQPLARCDHVALSMRQCGRIICKLSRTARLKSIAPRASRTASSSALGETIMTFSGADRPISNRHLRREHDVSLLQWSSVLPCASNTTGLAGTEDGAHHNRVRVTAPPAGGGP